jgi:PPM family protein phosphatase
LALISAGVTDIGMTRKSNQDSICIDEELKLFVVADGMGGHNGGDIASQLTVEHFPQFVRSLKDQIKDPKDLLKNCVQQVNQKIYTKAQAEPLLKGMGTTMVANYFHSNNLYLSNVGDSRCYLVQNSQLYQLSRDHSFVQELVNQGIYTRDVAKNDKQKNVITRTVGFEPNVDADVFTYKVCKNDVFLICSDGLHGKVSDPDILHLINQFIPDPASATRDDVKSLVQALIDQANMNGGQDNISVIITVAQ